MTALIDAVTKRLVPCNEWRIAAAHDMGDGWFALTLLCDSRRLECCDDADATAVVRWHRRGRLDEVLVVQGCSDDGAKAWLDSIHAEHSVYQATVMGRCA